MLPHSTEAERGVLSDILLRNDTLSAVLPVLRPDHFYEHANRRAYKAIERLAAQGQPVDALTLKTELGNDVDLVGGPAYLAGLLDGAVPSRNVSGHVRIVLDKARRRNVITRCNGIIEAAQQGDPERNIRELVEGLLDEGSTEDHWTPSTLEGVVTESTGDTEYVVDGLIPRGEVTIIGAGWKVGKTLIAYRAALDISSGDSVFGRFDVSDSEKVLVLQLEMPQSEDDRRFRRIAIGAGMSPSAVPRLVQDGRLVVYNRPPLDLTKPAGVARFHQVVRESGVSFVVIDSLIAAFAGLDLSDNSRVRRAFKDAFAPLTSDGISVVMLHHKRKTHQGTKRDDNKSALLGAQAWGAAAGRIYSLDRVADSDTTGDSSTFRARLHLVGSWTPETAADVILQISDMHDGELGDGTAIEALDEREQISRGGVTKAQQMAIKLAQLVQKQGRVQRQHAKTMLRCEHDCSDGTFKEAQRYGKARKWIAVVPSEGAKNNEVDFVVGEISEDF